VGSGFVAFALGIADLVGGEALGSEKLTSGLPDQCLPTECLTPIRMLTLSSALKKRVVEGQSGRIIQVKQPIKDEATPSMIKSHLQPSIPRAILRWSVMTPARRPEKAYSKVWAV
jgi:hypothetical protein